MYTVTITLTGPFCQPHHCQTPLYCINWAYMNHTVLWSDVLTFVYACVWLTKDSNVTLRVLCGYVHMLYGNAKSMYRSYYNCIEILR